MILGIDASQANRQNRSGTEWYAFYLIQEFKKLSRGRDDLRVRLYFRDVPRQDLFNNWPENWEARILRWPVRHFWGQIRLSWEMLVNPPDVLFCPAHTIPIIHPHPTLSRQGRGKERGGKTFTTLHDIGFVDNPELYDKMSLWYHRFSAWLAAKSATHIFTVSEFSRKRIVEHYKCPASKLTVTHLGLLPLNMGEKKAGYILFVGRLEPKKNILGMVRAYELYLQSLRAIAPASPSESEAGKQSLGGEIASSSDPGRSPRNDNPPDLIMAGRKVNIRDVDEYLAARPALRDKVILLGYIDESRKRELLAGAAMFLFPTFYEGFGLPILEAQAAGVPVITSDTASNPEVAGEGALLVDPHNVSEIAAAIKELLTNEELRNQKVRLGFENLKRFSWEETARKTWGKIFSEKNY